MPPGWSLVDVRIGRDEVLATFRGQSGLSARFTLTHPEKTTAKGALRTKQFAAVLAATRKDEALGELFSAVAASLERHESTFTWDDDIAPAVAAPVTSPPRIETPRVDPMRQRIALEAEIDRHLELTPWIDLGITFDWQACLAEAEALIERFVPYQSDPNYGVKGWRSLALRSLGGDPSRSAMPEGPEANDPARYTLTSVAEHCPKTMALLERLVHIDQCRVITFLALEPGARIYPHTDDLHRNVMHSVNIAYNMPAGCEFYVETNPDGSPNQFTRRAPFTDGSVLLMNVARFHWVDNRSNVRRIHLNARGPLKIAPEKLLDMARAQSGLHTAEALNEALAAKYAHPDAYTTTPEQAEREWFRTRPRRNPAALVPPP